MIRRKDEMEPVTRHELQKGMGDVTFHTFTDKGGGLWFWQDLCQGCV